MGKALLLIVAAVALSLGGVMLRSSTATLRESGDRTYERAEDIVAREIALTGLGEGETRVSEVYAGGEVYSGPWLLTGDYQGGAYEVRVELRDSLVVITSTGRYEDATHSVRRAYRPRARAVPSAMTYSLLIHNVGQIRGPLSVTAPAPMNANVHGNHQIQISSGTALVSGFGTATHRLTSSVLPLGSIFLPNYNPDGLVTYADGVAEVPIPRVDAAVYRPLASRVFGNNARLNGRYRMGTSAAPTVFYADGNLGTSGDVEFEGWGVVIVNGNFNVDHAIRLVGTPTDSRLLVIGARNVVM